MIIHIDPFQTLKSLISQKLSAKNLTLTLSEQIRLNKEFSYIEQKGLAEYFLIFSRLADICTRLNIYRSPATSATACWYVNYLLDISLVNPIKENYEFFEAFLYNEVDFEIEVGSGYSKILFEELEKELGENYDFIRPAEQVVPSRYMNDLNFTVGRKTFCCDNEKRYIVPKNTNLVLPLVEANGYYNFLYEQHRRKSKEFSKYLYKTVENAEINRLQCCAMAFPTSMHPYNIPLDDLTTLYRLKNDWFRLRREINLSWWDSADLRLISEILISDKLQIKVLEKSDFNLLPIIMQVGNGKIISLYQIYKIAILVAGMSVKSVLRYKRKLAHISEFALDDSQFQKYKISFLEELHDGCFKKSILTESEINELCNNFEEAFERYRNFDIHISITRSHFINLYRLAYYHTYLPNIKKVYNKYSDDLPIEVDKSKIFDMTFLDFVKLLPPNFGELDIRYYSESNPN